MLMGRTGGFVRHRLVAAVVGRIGPSRPAAYGCGSVNLNGRSASLQ